MKHLRKSLFCYFIILVLLFTLSAGNASADTKRPPQIPVFLLLLSPKTVSLEIAEVVAENHAKIVWSNENNLTRIAPYGEYDEDGNLFSYMIPFIMNKDKAPSHDEIFATVRAVTGGTDPRADKDFYGSVVSEIGTMGAIQVSATRTNVPVISVLHSLPPYFLFLDAAREEAKRRFGTENVKFEKMVSSPPHEYFEFSSNGEKLLLHAYTFQTMEEMFPYPDDISSTNAASKTKPTLPQNLLYKLWDKAKTSLSPKTALELNYIENYRRIPIVNWTHWCVPTSFSMVLGYYDNYDPLLPVPLGYGRLINYWFAHPIICTNNTSTNAPSLIHDMISDATCSWHNYLDFTNFDGYSISKQDIHGNAGNDWIFTEIVAEVTANRPFGWGIASTAKNGHSMAGYGYRIVGSQKFVLVYNTWGATRAQQAAEYNYLLWKDKPAFQTGMAKFIIGGGDTGQNAFLEFPRGDDVVLGNTPISWRVWGDHIKWTFIDYSDDGGRTWTTKLSYIPTSVGLNTSTINLNVKTTKGRIRIKSYDYFFNYIAGDGSKYDFTVDGLADLIPVPAAYGGFCRPDNGNLVVEVKNQGTVYSESSSTWIYFPCAMDGYSLDTPALAPGESTLLYFTIPAGCSGDYSFSIKVDIFVDVNEANENNNVAQGTCFR